MQNLPKTWVPGLQPVWTQLDHNVATDAFQISCAQLLHLGTADAWPFKADGNDAVLIA